MKSKKPRILAIIQIPPPIHGASFVGKTIKESVFLNSKFEWDFIRISTKSEKKTFVFFRQFVNLIALFFKILKCLLVKKYDFVYITPCASGFQFYKDYFITIIVKWFYRNKMVYHFHNKGISTNKKVPRIIKKHFFSNVQVILLSPLLYFDIEEYIQKSKIKYLPNGIQQNTGKYTISRIKRVKMKKRSM